jgi:hypothetical protein
LPDQDFLSFEALLHLQPWKPPRAFHIDIPVAGFLPPMGVWTFQNLTIDSEDETVIALVTLAKALLTDANISGRQTGRS